MIRITGGRFRGRNIQSPPSRLIRPTTGRVRESVFSSLQARIQGGRFLDLFAGSGLMGIEALSRGAEFVLAIEQNRTHCRLIQDNYKMISLSPDEAELWCEDVLSRVSQPCTDVCEDGPFDIIYADPPYGFEGLSEIVQALKDNGWLKHDGVMIIEHGRERGDAEPKVAGATRKVYGDTVLSWVEAD